MENKMKKNKLIKIKIVPGSTNIPNTADSSSDTNCMIFFNVFLNCESISQYFWGISRRQILADTQFKGNLVIKILTFGSNDENRLVII